MEERLDAVTLKLIEKLERAIEELDSYTVTRRIKEKSIEYEDEGKKPVNEKIIETEDISVEKGLIDRSALKQLVSALNELKGKEAKAEEESGISVFMSDEARELAQ